MWYPLLFIVLSSSPSHASFGLLLFMSTPSPFLFLHTVHQFNCRTRGSHLVLYFCPPRMPVLSGPMVSLTIDSRILERELLICGMPVISRHGSGNTNNISTKGSRFVGNPNYSKRRKLFLLQPKHGFVYEIWCIRFGENLYLARQIITPCNAVHFLYIPVFGRTCCLHFRSRNKWNPVRVFPQNQDSQFFVLSNCKLQIPPKCMDVFSDSLISNFSLILQKLIKGI